MQLYTISVINVNYIKGRVAVLEKIKKWLSCIMVLILSVILLPLDAFAADETDNYVIIS